MDEESGQQTAAGVLLVRVGESIVGESMTSRSGHVLVQIRCAINRSMLSWAGKVLGRKSAELENSTAGAEASMGAADQRKTAGKQQLPAPLHLVYAYGSY